MNCAHSAIRDFIFLAGLLLCALGVWCLLISFARGRAAAYGDRLLSLCKYDDEIAHMALDNMAKEHARVLRSGQYHLGTQDQ